MTRHGLAPVTFLMAACLAVLPAADSAAAGRLTPGVYYGLALAVQSPKEEALESVTATLHVSRTGRRLTAARLTLWCGRGRSTSETAVRLSLRANPAAAVRRDGTFSLAATGYSRAAGRMNLWLSGRFVSARYVRLVYRVRGIPARRSRDCRSRGGYWDLSPAGLYRGGVPPFSGCRSQRAGTLARNRTSRVFQQFLPWFADDPQSGGFVTHVYACVFARAKQRIHLGRNYDDETIEQPRLAGTLLAYADQSCGGTGFCQADIEVRDLRGDAVRTVSPVEEPSGNTFRVHDLVLKEDGSLAWTVARGSWYEETVAHQLWALDSQGRRLLDSGPNLKLRSLTLNGSTLTWINDGTTRTATLD